MFGNGPKSRGTGLEAGVSGIQSRVANLASLCPPKNHQLKGKKIEAWRNRLEIHIKCLSYISSKEERSFGTEWEFSIRGWDGWRIAMANPDILAADQRKTHFLSKYM